jgi:hypothetical protein
MRRLGASPMLLWLPARLALVLYSQPQQAGHTPLNMQIRDMAGGLQIWIRRPQEYRTESRHRYHHTPVDSIIYPD